MQNVGPPWRWSFLPITVSAVNANRAKKAQPTKHPIHLGSRCVISVIDDARIRIADGNRRRSAAADVAVVIAAVSSNGSNSSKISYAARLLACPLLNGDSQVIGRVAPRSAHNHLVLSGLWQRHRFAHALPHQDVATGADHIKHGIVFQGANVERHGLTTLGAEQVDVAIASHDAIAQGCPALAARKLHPLGFNVVSRVNQV